MRKDKKKKRRSEKNNLGNKRQLLLCFSKLTDWDGLVSLIFAVPSSLC
jgi:hypothetical protein